MAFQYLTLTKVHALHAEWSFSLLLLYSPVVTFLPERGVKRFNTYFWGFGICRPFAVNLVNLEEKKATKTLLRPGWHHVVVKWSTNSDMCTQNMQ